MTEESGFTEYRVTARKWRPRIFSEVTSQEFITKTLKNAIKNNRISHAYLFSGPRGVGKTTIARILAKSLNCLNPGKDGDPCNVCESCKEIDNDNRNHPDVFEIDGASNRNIEDVRELKEKVKYGPIRSRYKIFIIDEVHMLTGASFNALLKTLEEPPSYVVFMFATTAPEKVPLTILGRCQKFDFKRFTVDEIKARIKYIAEQEKIKIDDESLFFISKKGDGSMRDAQGLFDMSASYCNNNITFDKLKEFFNLAESDVYFNVTEYIKAKDGSGLLGYFDGLMNKGYDMQTFLDGLTEHYRNLLIAVSTGTADLIMESESIKEKYKNCIGRFNQIEIINSIRLVLQTEYTFRYSSNQRTLIEALLIELIKFADTKEISRIVEELKEMNTGSKKNDFDEENTDTERQPQKLSSAAKSPSPSPETVSYETGSESEHTPAVISLSGTPKEINSHWVTILEQIKSEKRWIYSLAKDSSFEINQDNNCTIRVPEQKLDSLNDYGNYISDKVSGYFGRNVKINITGMHEMHAPSGQTASGKSNLEKIESILVKDFRAKEVK